MADHPDFALPWVQTLLASPMTLHPNPPGAKHYVPSPGVTNSLFASTLSAPEADCLRAQIMFTRPHQPSPTPTPTTDPSTTDDQPTHEQCMLLSLGPGADGKLYRAHGGLSALLLDHLLGHAASVASGATAPATARLEVDYKAPVDTPGVVLCRGWLERKEGRKAWVRGVVEGEGGRVFAVGRALFVAPREGL